MHARRSPRPRAAPGRHPSCDDEAGGPQHPQRVVAERHLGVERRVEPLGREVLHAAEGVDELAVGQPHRHRVDGEVTPRQVGLRCPCANVTAGLRCLLGVDLLAEGRDLQTRSPFGAPTVPNLTPTRYWRSAQPRRTCVVSAGRRRSRSRISRRAPPGQIADGAAHQVELVPGGRETLAELVRERVDLEARRRRSTIPVGHGAPG